MNVHRHGPHGAPVRYVGLHGWAGTGALFAPLAAAIAGTAPGAPSSATLLAPDLPGYGASPAPARWDLDAIAAEVADAAVREGAGADGPVRLVGTCSGALLALHVARHWVRHGGPVVERLVLAELFAEMPWYFRVFLTPGAGRVFYASSFGNPVGRWLTQRGVGARAGVAKDAGDDAQAAALAESFARVAPRTTLAYLRLLGTLPGPDAYADVQAPVTLVAGARSFRAVHASLERWRHVWPDAEIHVIDGAGHLVLEEQPAAAAPLVAGDRPAFA